MQASSNYTNIIEKIMRVYIVDGTMFLLSVNRDPLRTIFERFRFLYCKAITVTIINNERNYTDTQLQEIFDDLIFIRCRVT